MLPQPRIDILEFQVPLLVVWRELVNVLSVTDQLNRCDDTGSPVLHTDRAPGPGGEVFSHEVIAQPKLQEDVVGGAVGAPLANRVEYRLSRVCLRVNHSVRDMSGVVIGAGDHTDPVTFLPGVPGVTEIRVAAAARGAGMFGAL